MKWLKLDKCTCSAGGRCGFDDVTHFSHCAFAKSRNRCFLLLIFIFTILIVFFGLEVK